MIFELFKYRCENCNCTFKSPELSGCVYGEFLMRTVEGETSYLDMICDPVIKEFDKPFNSFQFPSNYNDRDKSIIYQSILSICCDKSEKGLDFSIQQDPLCPMCLSSDKKIMIGPDNPVPETVELDIPPVTHNEWNKLSESEKLYRTEKAIEAYLSPKH